MKKILLLCQTMFFIFMFNGLNAQYCVPTYTNGCETGAGLTQFDLNTISQAITCTAIPPNPSYYQDYTSLSTDLAQNGVYDISVQAVTYGIYVKAVELKPI